MKSCLAQPHDCAYDAWLPTTEHHSDGAALNSRKHAGGKPWQRHQAADKCFSSCSCSEYQMTMCSSLAVNCTIQYIARPVSCQSSSSFGCKETARDLLQKPIIRRTTLQLTFSFLRSCSSACVIQTVAYRQPVGPLGGRRLHRCAALRRAIREPPCSLRFAVNTLYLGGSHVDHGGQPLCVRTGLIGVP